MVRRAVVVMGKVPQAGRVKTRLTPPLSPEAAAQLYAAFLQDVFCAVEGAEGVLPYRKVFACAGSKDEARALTPKGWSLVLQRGDSLGERLEAARADADADQVVMLGSDAPTMPPARIHEAFGALSSGPGRRVVLGPSKDGGYYLIGLSQPEPLLFRDMPWSTPKLFRVTRERARAARIEVIVLEEGFDIDDSKDLNRAHREAQSRGAHHTLAAIERVLRDSGG